MSLQREIQITYLVFHLHQNKTRVKLNSLQIRRRNQVEVYNNVEGQMQKNHHDIQVRLTTNTFSSETRIAYLRINRKTQS